ncbi:MAG: response regulator [Pseudomonadota bacterium]
MTASKILIVEDEIKIANVLREFLEASGYVVEILHEGTGAIDHILTSGPSLIILDLMLPGVDGLTICKEVRSTSDVPIIMLTAKVDEIDRLLGLELGADDYICKPFSAREVVARVRTILRRVSKPQRTDGHFMVYEHIRVSPDEHKAYAGKTLLELTPVEFRMLNAMILQPGRVHSREQLMTEAYNDYRIVSDRTIDSHIKNLRKKLTVDGIYDDLVKSIYGVGYKLE